MSASYPGIPPGARDRPQAAVKGAVEVRVGPAGAKAKWVRVELKKIETLPGGGQGNSYFDHVGPSPISLWQSSEDYSVLQSQDLPFLIRIPESIPPSIALERGAGIRYELVATVCTLGKKGFFRRRKTALISQATTIIIDKHELHSTWPVYSQPESRSVNHDGVHLTVERGRTCYGPGDRVSVMAILKSDAVHPVTLRGFEFTLKETTIFRAGPQASSKRSGPQAKVANIGEQKVPLNGTLNNGTQHKAELGCLIPNTHTTTTLNAARHIDITYVIIVRAWIGSMQSVMMELPVIVSNWPRRIGHAPSLCVTSPSSPAATVPITTSIIRPQTDESHNQNNNNNRLSGVNDLSPNPRSPPKQFAPYSTAPGGYNGNAADGNEFGVLGGASGTKMTGTIDHPGYGSSNRPGSRGGLGGIQEDTQLGAEGQVSHLRPIGRRRPSASNRLTITNISEKDAEDGLVSKPPRVTTPPARNATNAWLSAEAEKQLLYENAVARVQKVQGAAAISGLTEEDQVSASPAAQSSNPRPSEPEKVRLWEEAQATAKRTQAYGLSSPSLHSRTSSEAHSPGPREKLYSPSATPGPAMSAGRALYEDAVSSIAPKVNGSTGAANIRTTPPSPPSSLSRAPHYPSAKEEKEALRRTLPALAAQRRDPPSPPPHTEDVPSYADPPPDESGLSEKEILRRRLEEQDRVALLLQQQQQQPSQEQSVPEPPPRINGTRAPPVPPTVNGFKPLTAAEEKARLRAKYEVEEQAEANAYALDLPPSRHPYATATPPSELAPPPLMPRPPAEYIQETQEADFRGRFYDTLGVGLASALEVLPSVPSRVASPANPRLEMRPFSPFDAGYDPRLTMLHDHVRPPPPPPPAAQY
ncbi:hypothetical protein JVU11DRAFT_5638 [Chiua virens]|nr:hypothetical protein JVU11DRAFT_5638 [Chiua virens]